jgi:hypothetical protein
LEALFLQVLFEKGEKLAPEQPENDLDGEEEAPL